jgi:methylated-DNA-[protein]-cysteine S-methyltransferase
MGSQAQKRTNHRTSGIDARDRVIFFGGLRAPRFRTIWIAASVEGLVAIELGGSRQDFVTGLIRRTHARVRFAPGRVRPVANQIRQYLAGRRRAFAIRIDWSAIPGAFQRRALSAVLSIPYGHTVSYKTIAAQIGRPQAVRAVGRANATNPVPLVIPCHRVVGADGSLRGYGGAGGVVTKAWLIDMEAAHVRQAARGSLHQPARSRGGRSAPSRRRRPNPGTGRPN